MRLGLSLARTAFSFVSLGLLVNVLLFQETTLLEVKIFMIILQVAIFVLCVADWQVKD